MNYLDIKINKDNPRTIKDDKYKKLVKSLKEFPQMATVRPVVIDEDNVILGGNMRFKAMVEAGWDDIPVTQVKGWTEEQKKEFIVKDNLGYGEWDYDILANDYDLQELEDMGMDLPADLQPDLEVEEDEAPEVDDKSEPISKLGEVYQLGKHRLMCGDSTKIEDVEKLMDGKRADMVFTDPPYGMKKESEGVLNDNLNFDDLLEFNKQWIPLSFTHLKENGSWYCWGIDEPLMDIYAFILKPYIKENKITFRNLITWDKGNGQGQNSEEHRMYAIADEKLLFVMTGVQGFNQSYFSGWEEIRSYLVAQKKIAKLNSDKINTILGTATGGGGMAGHFFREGGELLQWTIPSENQYRKLQIYCEENNIDAFKRDYNEIKRDYYATRAYFDNTHDNMNNVWHFNRTGSEERKATGEHVTPKPLALCSRAIKSSSRENEIVLDVFGGSGSTLIACEQTDRTCYMMELSEKYVDIIRKRYHKFVTGNEDGWQDAT